MPIDSEALRHIPLFAQLSREELAHVAAMTVERHYDRGDMILLEGDMGGALHYVYSARDRAIPYDLFLLLPAP
jgi:CRP-like cAMP-binding protein